MAPRPRGRSRKRDTRMDAALDAMAQYGFDPKLVTKTVKELLNVYSVEGWIFIEDGAYKLLIDTLLEKGEKEGDGEGEGEDGDKGNSSSHVNNTPSTEPETNEHVDTAPGTNEARESISPGNGVHDPVAPSKEVRDPASPSKEVRDHVSPSKEVRDHALPSNKSAIKPPINSEQNVHKNQADNSTENPNVAPPYKIIPRPSYDGFPPREVKPCHGWIDDKDEIELIELTPAPLPERLLKMLNRVDGIGELAKKKRRSRWDVKPDDP